MKLSDSSLFSRAKKALLKGQTLIYPTDTVWGIGCDARNAEAVHKIISIKNKEAGNGLIVLIPDIKTLKEYTESNISMIEESTTNQPTSWILPSGKNLSEPIFAEDGSLAIRIPQEPHIQQFIQYLGFPLVSTSANFHGKATPQTYNEIDPKLIEQIDFVFNPSKPVETNKKSSRIIKIDAQGNQLIIRE